MEKSSTLIDAYDKYDRISIIKINSNNKVLHGSEYKIETFDGKEVPGKAIVNEAGTVTYFLDSNFFASYENTISLLPNILKDEINSYQNQQDFFNSWVYDEFVYSVGNFNQNNYIIAIPIKIIETKSPVGYKARNMTSFLRYNFLLYTQNEEKLKIEVSHHKEIPVLYDIIDIDTTDYNYYKYQFLTSYKHSSLLLNRKCGEQIVAGPSTFNEDYCTDYAYFFENEEGTIKLEISNTVNNLTKYNASKNKNLEYKIRVRNSGDAPSGNNVITTNVPKKITVDETSISLGGSYNKEENTIVWTIDRIENEKEVMVSYKAVAMDNANGDELIGNSMVTSDQQTATVYSNNTIVTLDRIVEIIHNPNTGKSMIYIPNTNIGMPLSVLFIMIIVICITSLLIILRKNKTQSY